jgi:hypothetical protein
MREGETHMTKIKPHPSLGYIRPDEVAECWDGVDDTLYRALWSASSAIEKAGRSYDPEITEEPVIGGHDTIAANWKLFDDETKEALNALAKEKDHSS